MNRTSAFALIALAACGTVDSGDPDPVDHSTPDGGPGTSPEPVPNVAPVVISVDPPTGSTVEEDVSITITFSEPMDQATVEAALSFPGSSPPAFSWDPNGTAVTASHKVAYPDGSDPAQVAPRSFQIALAAAAADLEGEALGEETLLDYTLRYKRITAQFPFSQTLSGNCDAACSGNFTWFAAGERSADPTISTRGFLTVPFDLPDDIQIEHAELATEIEQVIDNPFSFGDLYIDHVQFDAITGDEYNARGTGLGVLFARTDAPAAGDAVKLDVTDAFADDYEHRAARQNRTQYRIRFPHDLAEDPSYSTYHSDGAWDVLELLRDATGVKVTYLVE